MDLSGAAIATVIANWCIVPACLVSMIKSKQNKLVLKDLTPNIKYSKKIWIHEEQLKILVYKEKSM